MLTCSAVTSNKQNSKDGAEYERQTGDITLSDIRNRRGGIGADGGLMLSL